MNLDPTTWATESYKLAVSHAYAIPKGGRIGQDYFERSIPAVEQRLPIAGVRPAALPNAVSDEAAGLDVIAQPAASKLFSIASDPLRPTCFLRVYRGLF